MARGSRRIDVAALIDQRRLSGFNYRLILFSWAITLFDGLDIMMVSFTAPYMRDELHLSKTMLGYVFSAGTAGMTIGAFVFSYLGDRIGRRPTVIGCAFVFGVLTILTAFAQDLTQLITLRFLDGLAIGGMLPIAWALNIEFVPQKMRSTVVTIIMMGYSLGSAFAAPLTNWIAPSHGWQGVYLFGGIATLFVAAGLSFVLPESPRFLVARGRNNARVAAVLKRMDPQLDVAADDDFYLGDEQRAKANFHVRDLFAGRLKLITPLMWLGYCLSSLAIFFSSSWGPSVLEELAVPRHEAALISSGGALLGAFTGITIMRLHERVGLGLVALLPALCVPVLLLLGFGLLPTMLFLPMIVVQMLLIGGEHSAIISLLGVYYPSAIRASGGGWAASIGKMGGVAGPIIGAAILSSGLPILRSYALLAVCPAVLFVCLMAISRIVRGPVHPEQVVPEPVPAS